MPASLALLPEAAVALDARGVILAASPPTAKMFQRDPVGIGDRRPRRLPRAAVGGARGRRRRARSSRWCRSRAGAPTACRSRSTSASGCSTTALLCLLREVDRQQPSTLDEAFDQMPLGMALFNTDGEYVRVNAALCALLGRTADELIGMRDQELTHPDDRQSDVDAAWRILRGELSTWQCEKRFVRPDGEVVWTLANLTFLRDEFGRPLCWVGQFQDITELRRMASRDPLTDALNRRAFDIELERCAASGRAGALLVLDLDGFKEINDAHGHHAGDELLRTTAEAISGRLRRGDVLARLGGDEFAVLLPRLRDGPRRARRGRHRRRWSPRSASCSTASSAPSPPASGWPASTRSTRPPRSSRPPTARCTRPRRSAAAASAVTTRCRTPPRPSRPPCGRSRRSRSGRSSRCASGPCPAGNLRSWPSRRNQRTVKRGVPGCHAPITQRRTLPVRRTRTRRSAYGASRARRRAGHQREVREDALGDVGRSLAALTAERLAAPGHDAGDLQRAVAAHHHRAAAVAGARLGAVRASGPACTGAAPGRAASAPYVAWQAADGTTCWVAPSSTLDAPCCGPVAPRPTVSVVSPSAGGVAAIGSGATPVTGRRRTITAMSLIGPGRARIQRLDRRRDHAVVASGSTRRGTRGAARRPARGSRPGRRPGRSAPRSARGRARSARRRRTGRAWSARRTTAPRRAGRARRGTRPPRRASSRASPGEQSSGRATHISELDVPQFDAVRSLTRRGLIAGGLPLLGAGGALLHASGARGHIGQMTPANGHDHGGHANFRGNVAVDHARNGFDPHEIVRDFDWGTTTPARPTGASSASGSCTRSTRRSRSCRA